MSSFRPLLQIAVVVAKLIHSLKTFAFEGEDGTQVLESAVGLEVKDMAFPGLT